MAAAAAAPFILGQGRAVSAPPAVATPTVSARAAFRPAGCPPEMLPDGDGVCVRLAAPDEGAPAAQSVVNAHRDRSGDWVVYDQIPRRPDRPEDYSAYMFPVPCPAGCVMSGYDLDRPDALQRRGARLRAVGHGAVDLAAPRGTPVVALGLEHQVSATRVAFVGPLFGNTVVTRHTLLEGGERRDYLVVLGHLDSVSPAVVAGSEIRDGDVVGLVGDSGSKGVVHLHYEVRRWRAPAPMTSEGAVLIDDAHSIVCDPRNVLPLRPRP